MPSSVKNRHRHQVGDAVEHKFYNTFMEKFWYNKDMMFTGQKKVVSTNGAVGTY